MSTNKPGSSTHHSIILRPMPGSRFTIWGADCHLEFKKGDTEKQVQFILNWVRDYLQPLAAREAMQAHALAEQAEVPVIEESDTPIVTEAAAPEEDPTKYHGPKPITSFPFIKVANGSDRGGFKPEDYEKNQR